MIRNLLKAANALTFSTMFLLLLAGCNKNTIIFEDGTTPNGSSGNEDPGNSTLVTFNASVEGRNLLRSMSPMNKGIQSRVYVFDSSAGTKGSPEASGLYITSSPGGLTGVTDIKCFSPMALIISTPYPTISPRSPRHSRVAYPNPSSTVSIIFGGAPYNRMLIAPKSIYRLFMGMWLPKS